MGGELLDHVLVLDPRHLLRLVRDHIAYDNEDRPHMALADGQLDQQNRFCQIDD